MENFFDILLGEITVSELLAYSVFGILGATVYLYIKVRNRHKSDNGKPSDWSWRFFFRDNTKRMVATLFFVFIWARFSKDLTAWVPSGAESFGQFSYVLIGFGTDVLVVYFGKKLKELKDKFSS